MPTGRLILRATVADATDTTLDNVSGLEAFLDGQQLNIYASSESEGGIRHFSVDVGPVGQTFYGDASAESQTGGANNDVLEGAAGDDTIDGGAGDDILSDGAGEDRLTGGAGSEVFVLTQDGARDLILDFEPGIDRIDLSLFQFLFSVKGLTVTSTSYGATITFADDVTEICRVGGGTLDFEDLGGDELLPLSHGILPNIDEGPPDLPPKPTVVSSFQLVRTYSRQSNEGGRDGAGPDNAPTAKVFFRTKSGNDSVIGAHSNETLDGGEGNDTLDGWNGDDVLTGRSGSDTFVFGRGHDRILDFDVYWDILQLTPDLWDDVGFTAEQVLETYGTATDMALVLSFDRDTSLTIEGVTTPASIVDQIVF